MTWSLSTTSPLSIIVLKIGRDRGHVPPPVVRDSPSLPKSRGAVVVVQPTSLLQAPKLRQLGPLRATRVVLDLDQHTLLRNNNAIELSTLLSKLAHSIQVSLSLNRSVPAGKWSWLSGSGLYPARPTDVNERRGTGESPPQSTIIMMLSSASFQKFLSLTVITTIVLSLVYIHTWFVAWTREEAGFPIAVNHEEVEGETGKSGYHRNAGVLKYVNPKIGTYGVTPNGNGGMIPSVGMPFGMTRWTAVTREVCILPAGSSCL